MAPGIAFDATSRTYTYRGPTMVYFVRNGQLFQVSLRKVNPTTAQRISSVAAACQVLDWHPLRYDGSDDAWVEISEAGPDGACDQATDNRILYVRTGDPATTAPISLPDGVEMQEALLDPVSGTLSGFIAVDSRGTISKLVYYSASWSPQGDVAGSNFVSSLEFMDLRPGTALSSSAYVLVDGSDVWRLEWSNTSATLAAPIYYSFGTPDAYSFSDANAMYFVDGRTVLKITGAGAISSVGTVSSSPGDSVSLVGMTSGHLVLQAYSYAGTSLHAQPKAGGLAIPLATTAIRPMVQGLHGDDIVYTADSGFTGRQVVRRVHASGTNDRLIASAAGFWPMVVYRATGSQAEGLGVSAVVWCEPAPAAIDCRNGSLRSFDLGSEATTTLGTISTSSNPFSWGYTGYGIEGQALVFTTYSTDSLTQLGASGDVYLARPGSAGSLVRLTANIP
jgi:hypothetical protein